MPREKRRAKLPSNAEMNEARAKIAKMLCVRLADIRGAYNFVSERAEIFVETGNLFLRVFGRSYPECVKRTAKINRKGE